MFKCYRGKSLSKITLVILLSLTGLFEAVASERHYKTDIITELKAYEKALNDGNVDNVMQRYTKDGVFMPSNKPTSIGQAQVKTAYQYVFKELDLNVKFHVNEIVKRDDLAFVRTTSNGTIKLLNKNMTIKNNSRELFVMKRVSDSWKIYRYMFNEMGAPEVVG